MAPVPADPSRFVDRSLLTDRSRCPLCGRVLPGPRCPACGVSLSGTAAQRVWDLSVQAARLLDTRDAALVELRRTAFVPPLLPAAPTSPAAPAAPMTPAAPAAPFAPPSEPRPVPAPPLGMPLPTPPLPATPTPAPTPAPTRVSVLDRVGVQVVLVGLGALLLAVSVVVFLVVSWDRLSLGGRAAIVAGLTLTALGVSWRLRSGLRATAEAIGALGVVMVLADAWAVRGMGLFGADRLDAWAYAAGAAAGCALLLGGWALVSGVRAGSLAGALLAPSSAVLAGAYGVHRGHGLGWLGLGALVAAVVTAVRPMIPDGDRAERVVLRLWAAAGLVVTAIVCLPLTVGHDRAVATGLLVLACAVAVLQARCDLMPVVAGRPATQPGVDLRRLWSAASGAALVASALPASLGLVDAGHADTAWTMALAPALGGLLALAAVRATPLLHAFGVRGRAMLTAIGVLFGALALPAAVLASGWLLLAAATPLPAWRGSAGSALARLMRPVQDTNLGALISTHAAAALGLAALAVTAAAASRLGGAPVARRARPLLDRWAIGTAVAAVVLGCLAPALPVWAVIALLGAVAVAGGAALARPAASVVAVRAGTAAATVAGTLGVLLSWNVRALSVPVTLAGIGALVLARRPAPAALRPLLVGVAMAALAPTAGATAALAGRGTADRVTVAGLALAIVTALLAGVRSWPRGVRRPAGPPWARPERLGAVLVGLGGMVVALVVVAAGDLVRPDPLRQAYLLAAAVVVAVAAVSRREGPLGVPASAVAAAALPPLVAALGLELRDADLLGLPLPFLLAGTASATALLVAGLTLAGGGRRADDAAHDSPDRAADPRRIPAEVAAAVVAVASLIVTSNADQLWVVLLLLGTGVSALSALPDRRRLGWLAGVLLTASSWVRLGLADVGVVEAYTLPPAAALLVVGALRLRRDRAASPWRALGPGTAGALLPSVAASWSGGELRPWVLLVVAAVAVVAGFAVPAVRDLGVPGAAAAVAASAVGVGRGLVALADDRYGVIDVERWSVPAAAVLLGAGLLLSRTSRPPRPVTAVGADPAQALGAPVARMVLPPAWAAAAALALALGMSLLAAVDQALPGGGAVLHAHEGPRAVVWRCAAVLVAGLVVALAAAVRRVDGVRAEPVEAVALAAATVAAGCGWLSGSWPVETWAVPLGLAYAAVGAGRLWRGRVTRGAQLVRIGMAVGLGPSVLAAVNGSPLRPALLLAVAVTLAALAVAVARRMPAPDGAPALLGELIHVGLIAAVAVAGSVGLLRSLAGVQHADPGPLAVEVWSLPAAVVVVGTALVVAGSQIGTGPWWRWVAPAGLLLAWVPTTAAVAVGLARHGSGAGILWTEHEQLLRAVRGAGVFALAGAVVVADAWVGEALRARAARVRLLGREPVLVALLGACTAAGLGWWDRPREEWRWAVPLAAVLLLAGAVRLARVPGMRSWPALAPGLVILLGPSLWVAWQSGGTVRIVWLVVAGAVVVVVGAVRRLQAPLVLGAIALALHAVVQLGPWIVQLAGTVPRWVVLSLAGALLLGLGTTYERRLKQVRDVRLMVTGMR
jgi:hypothetical protein